jgi:heme exporter protein A
MHLSLQASGLRKVFNRRPIFDGIGFRVQWGETLLITGRNGSGKSTLVKIIADVLTPSAGEVALSGEEGAVRGQRQRYFGLVSPYLQLYDEFSAEENLRLAQRIRGLKEDEHEADRLFDVLGILHRKRDPVRAYSSGMKQRAKYAMALIHRPPVLLLDEPMSNLDAEGIEAVRGVMQAQRTAGILVVATNDLTDVEYVEHRVDLHGTR